MLRPKLPDTPHVPSITTHIPQDHSPAPAHSAGRPVAPYVGAGVGAVAAVVVVGVVLTALLVAVAISAISVAIAAVVLRSLVNGANKR
ncbi:SpdD protein [Streptomyces sp. KM273126]|uniref:SpdD protein n=1 Tax=Streptomyces sp. KM273126 TaxID=2545247 RepID=UPI001404A2C3|nr:SpdD protein [Streptomyces sp. KM273126]MBA2807427.1 SpdD protein [Streptomyces sp. KM273126]